MRVLLASEWHPLSVGGVQTHVREQAESLVKRGFEVFVISRICGGKINCESHNSLFKTYTVSSIFPFDIILVPPDPFKIREIVEKIRPDVVHAHHAFTFLPLITLRIAESLSIPRILTNHSAAAGYDYNVFWRTSSYILIPYRKYISKANTIISVSRAADKFISHFVNNSVKRVIIPNGINTKRFTPPVREVGDLRVLFVGRLVYRKGVHVLLKSFSRVSLEVPEARLTIVGKGYLEPLLRGLASIMDLKERVEFKGFIDEALKPEIYRESRILVVPSIYGESFGIVVLEGMASGRPVIASNTGGLSEIVEDGVNGLLVEPGNPYELADKIILLLEDRKLWKRLSVNARIEAVLKYSWDVVVEKIIGMYEGLYSNYSTPKIVSSSKRIFKAPALR